MPRRGGLDVYLLPAVVGGGLGDIEEVLLAGRVLGKVPGVRLRLFRAAGRPMPASVEGPWDWPSVERVDRPEPRAARALTLSAEWGVSAAPGRPEPYGRPGPWALESDAIEQAYGSASVVHLSLEEFARTLTSLEESRERYREGGVPVRAIAARLRTPAGRREVAEYHAAYRKFRAFDRPNLLAVYATFRPSRAFALEYPEAIQTGPLWPGWPPRPRRPRRAHRPEWVWYASPASSPSLVPEIDRALDGLRSAPRITVRSPRPWTVRVDPARWRFLVPRPPGDWRRRFRAADLRIVTGSRTLLEALELGGPFLYYNGVLGTGRSRRRHRPEKIAALLGAGRSEGVGGTVIRDLAAFASGRNVHDIVRRAARGSRVGRGFPAGWRPNGFPPPFDDAASYLRHAATAWIGWAGTSRTFTADMRREGRRAIGIGPRLSEV